jgi:hypothetical protein
MLGSRSGIDAQIARAPAIYGRAPNINRGCGLLHVSLAMMTQDGVARISRISRICGYIPGSGALRAASRQAGADEAARCARDDGNDDGDQQVREGGIELVGDGESVQIVPTAAGVFG